MRELADSARIEQFMRTLGRAAKGEGRVYLTGGATAVLHAWRATTIDVDIKLIPDRDELLREIPRLKEKLNRNVELAAPSDFIPLPDGWEERSPLIRKEGNISFHHFDLVALSKTERGHEQDLRDVKEMIASGLIDPAEARAQSSQSSRSCIASPPLTPTLFAGQ